MAFPSAFKSTRGEKRKSVILKEAREERQFANQLTKEMQQRVKDERWLTKELKREQEQRERENKKAAKGFGLLNRVGAELAGTLGAFGIMEAAHGVAEFARESVGASVKVEGFRNSLTALYGDAQIASNVLAGLQELAQLPGITFESAVQGAVRLKTVGVEGARAEGVIREFGNAAALSGAGAEEMGRSFVGLSQILSKGSVDQENLNQILENTPLIATSIKTAFESIDAEVIQAKLESSGQSVQDFVDILTNQLSKGARASADSTRNAFSNLENATFLLKAAIGDELSPVVRSVTLGLTELFESITDFVAPVDKARDALQFFRKQLSDADTILERSDAIDARIAYLDNLKQAHFDAANELDKFDRKRRERLQGEIDDANVERGTLTLIQGGDLGVAQLQSEIEGLIDTYSELVAEETKREAQTLLTHLAVSNVAAARLKVIRKEKDEVASQIEQYQGFVKVAEAANTVVAAATEKTTEATQKNTKSTKEAKIAWVDYNDAIKKAIANIKAYETEQKLLSAQSDMWAELAKGTEGYGDTLELLIPKVTDVENEHKTLFQSIEQGY